ncbi:MAG: porin family protein [Bacteroidia bacterium]
MKKYLLFLGLLFFSSSANSQIIISLLLGDKLNSGQVEFGLDGGYNLSTITGLNDAKGLSGFNLGFYFDIKTKNPNWMFNTGVIVKSPMGADDLPVYFLNNPDLDTAFIGGSVSRKLRYFNVPFMMKYTFKNNFYVKSGIQLGLRSKCFDEFKKSILDDDDLKYKIDIKDQYHLIDGGLALGIGYRLMKGYGMNIGAQYYLGLMDITVDDSTPGQFNRVLYVTVGIPIGKATSQKKNQKEENKTD